MFKINLLLEFENNRDLIDIRFFRIKEILWKKRGEIFFFKCNFLV